MNISLTADEARQLKDIYAPTVVAVPDADAYKGLCTMPDGRIRFYGEYMKKSVFDENCKHCYIESSDSGLSWKRHVVDDPNTLCSSKQIPFDPKGRYIAVKRVLGEGLYVLRGSSPDDTSPEKIFVTDEYTCDMVHPFFCEGKNRIIFTICETRKEIHHTAFFNVLVISDDCGDTWKLVHTDSIPLFEKTWPHKGCRWQQNTRENRLVELSDGRLMMITRTAEDYHYIQYSSDFGDTWTAPERSSFHSMGTMPGYLKLSDGRIVFFWCNTKPMPEVKEADGEWEDFFTNRDANHVAISEDDGKTWTGFREIAFNPHRNSADFRSVGGPECSRDKSVHQFEAMELPFGKILLVYGQHYACRKIVIFDINWIYEKNAKEDFLHGFANISTHGYVKSISGGHRGTRDNPNSRVGHCAYNRISTCLLVPSPENDFREALSIRPLDDDRLLKKVSGAAWNFPAAMKGTVRIRMNTKGAGLRLSLLDHLINPTDDTVGYFADFTFVVLPDMLDEDKIYTDIFLDFDCIENKVTVRAGDGSYLDMTFGMQHLDHRNGFCYLHMQSVGNNTEDESLISEIEFSSGK